MKLKRFQAKSLLTALALAGSMLAGQAFAGGSVQDVTVLRVFGPQLGVRLAEVDKEAALRLKLPEEKGALVIEVLDNSTASKAGIRKDDVIVAFQGEPILSAAQLERLVREVPAGRNVVIDLTRVGAPLKVTAAMENGEGPLEKVLTPNLEALNKRLGETFDLLGEERSRFRQALGPGEGQTRAPGGLMLFPSGHGRLGVTYSEIEGQLARHFKAPQRTAILVNSVADGSPAAKAGVRAGDLVVRLGKTAIQNTADLQQALTDLIPGKRAPVTVWRSGQNVNLSVLVSEDAKPGTSR